MKTRLTILLLLTTLSFCDVKAQSRAGDIDIFVGAELNYRDIFYNSKLMELLINATPGVKWNMGKRWEATAQVIIPIVNDYGDYYKRIRLNNLSVSKQLAVGNILKLKASGGLFCSERYGLDIKAMLIVNEWLAVRAQTGLTGHFSMANGWNMSKMARWTGQFGPDIYLKPWNTQISLRGGRYVYGDYGGVAEAYRHFKHTSIGVYCQYSNKGNEDYGFKVVMMIPPYKRRHRKLNIRPASNFRLTYSQKADAYSNRMYFTEPEENERTGWFDRDILPWGQDKMDADFVYTEPLEGVKSGKEGAK